jgi:hypothetical protein
MSKRRTDPGTSNKEKAGIKSALRNSSQNVETSSPSRQKKTLSVGRVSENFTSVNKSNTLAPPKMVNKRVHFVDLENLI